MKNLIKGILLGILVLLAAVALFIYFIDYRHQESEDSSPSTKEKIFFTIAGFDFSEPKSFYSISEINDYLDEETISLLQELMESDSISERWAAIILLPQALRQNENLKDSIIPSLKKGINDEDDTLRMLTGAQLTSLGEKEGLSVLISCLESEETTHFGEPPELVKERSLFYLQHYTDYQGKEMEEWEGWWQGNKNKLSWNQEREVFEIK